MTVERPSGPFRIGDRVQLTGPKGRLHTITLREDGELHTHHGVLRHTALIGQPDGSVVANSARPRVPRAAAAAARLRDVDAARRRDRLPEGCRADPRRGRRVPGQRRRRGRRRARVRCRCGCCARSATSGRLVSFERRAEFADVARANVETFLGGVPENWERRRRRSRRSSCRRPWPPASVDRVVLDMLAPWECIDVVADALTPGGVVLCYVATATQLSRVAEYIRGTGLFTEPDANETMVRGWHVEGLAVRPDHRMVAHTGFLVWARRLAPGAVPPEVKRRARRSRATATRTSSCGPPARSATVRSPTRTSASAFARRSGPRTAPGPRRTAPTSTTISGSSSSAGSAGPWHLDCSGAQDPRCPRGPRTRRRRPRRLLAARFERAAIALR